MAASSDQPRYMDASTALEEQKKIRDKYPEQEWSKAAIRERATNAARYPAQIRRAQQKVKGWKEDLKILKPLVIVGEAYQAYERAIERAERLESSGIVCADARLHRGLRKLSAQERRAERDNMEDKIKKAIRRHHPYR